MILRIGMPHRLGVRFRATAAAVAVVAVALALSVAVLVILVGRTVGDSVSAAVLTQADEVATELAGDASTVQLAQAEGGVRVQVVRGGAVVAASRSLRGRPPLSPARPASSSWLRPAASRYWRSSAPTPAMRQSRTHWRVGG